MGRIYMNFGDPVILEQAPAADDQLAIPKIAFDVAVQANKVTPVTMPSLACLCLLRAAPRALTVEELQADIVAFANWIIARNIMVTSDFNPDRLANVQTLANAMVDSGLLVRYDQGSGTVYGIESERQPVASYYRNTISSLFRQQGDSGAGTCQSKRCACCRRRIGILAGDRTPPGLFQIRVLLSAERAIQGGVGGGIVPLHRRLGVEARGRR